jgi:hypothetical protein
MKSILLLQILLLPSAKLCAQTDSFCLALTSAISQIPNNFEGIKGDTFYEDYDYTLFDCTLRFPGAGGVHVTLPSAAYLAHFDQADKVLSWTYSTSLTDSLAAVAQYDSLVKLFSECVANNDVGLDTPENWTHYSGDGWQKLNCSTQEEADGEVFDIELHFAWTRDEFARCWIGFTITVL